MSAVGDRPEGHHPATSPAADWCALLGVCGFAVAALLPGQPLLATAFYACLLAWLPRLVVLRGASFRNSFRDGILTLFALLVAWLAITSLLAESPSASLTFLRRHHLRALIVACIAADVLRDPKRLRFFCVFLACLAFALCALETVTIAGLLRANAEWVLRYGSNSVREFGPGLVFCLPLFAGVCIAPSCKSSSCVDHSWHSLRRCDDCADGRTRGLACNHVRANRRRHAPRELESAADLCSCSRCIHRAGANLIGRQHAQTRDECGLECFRPD